MDAMLQEGNLMNIVVVGVGKVGHALVRQLDAEGHDVTVIENKAQVLEHTLNYLDVVGVQGSGTDVDILREAGVPRADLVIAATSTDETNIVTCLLSRRIGAARTIARIRNPEFHKSSWLIKDDLGLSMLMNPENAAASEIIRCLLYSSKVKVYSFAKGRMEMAEGRVGENSPLAGRKINEIDARGRASVQFCIIQRDNEVIIPGGETVIHSGDKLSVAGSTREIEKFFAQFWPMKRRRLREVMIVGGSRIANYLASRLLELNIEVKIIEKDREKADEIAARFPQVTVICGDGTDQTLLLSENLQEMDGFVSLTDNDEENVIISMFAERCGVEHVVPKVNRVELGFLLEKLGLSNAVTPKNIAADNIVQYVRAMQNSVGSNVESIIQAADGAVEVLEFRVASNCRFIGRRVKDLPLKSGILVAYITHKSRPHIARGDTLINEGDSFIVVSKVKGLRDINDVLAASNGKEAELAGHPAGAGLRGSV